MLFYRVSLLVYVSSMAISTTFALPTPFADSTHDMTVSRRQELSNVGVPVHVTNLPPAPHDAPTPTPVLHDASADTPPPLSALPPDATSGNFCNGNLCGHLIPNPDDPNGCDENPNQLVCIFGPTVLDRRKRTLLDPEAQTPPEVQTSSKVGTLPNIQTYPEARARVPKARGSKIRPPLASQLG